MPTNTIPLVWRRCRGRNGWDPAIDVSDDMATEVLNFHFYDGALGKRRSGCLTTGTLTAISGLNALFSWVPGQDETARELFCVDNTATNKVARMAAGSSFTALTVGDAINTSSDTVISWAVINGKLYIAYDSTLNRLHVFDPGLSTTALRRSGMGTPAAATAATLGGAGLTFTGTYKVRYTEQRSSVTVRRSEASASVSVSITDDSGIQVTKPASISEGETHWELYRLHTDNLYYLIATTVVGTTTYNDTSATVSTTLGTEPIAGEYTPFPSVKYLYSDGKTLFGLGVWETSAGDSHTPQAGTVYHTPALDTTSTFDDERCRNTVSAVGRVILGRNAGGVDRGLGGLGNVVYAFQSKGIFQLTPTENPDIRFRRTQISDDLGAVSHTSICKFIDQNGKPALYFLDPLWGPYRIGERGIEWVGKDVKDLWDGVNLAASNVVAWACPIPEIGGLLFAFATGSSNDPDTGIFYDPTEARTDENGDLRGGWAKWTGPIVQTRCATLMSATLGATMSRNLTLYVGAASGTNLMKYLSTARDDDGTNYQAYIQSKAWEVDPEYDKELIKSYLLSTTVSAVTVTQTLIRNFGDETSRTSTTLLTPTAAGETRALKKFEDAALADAVTFQVRLGDGAAANSVFTFDRWIAHLKTGAAR